MKGLHTRLWARFRRFGHCLRSVFHPHPCRAVDLHEQYYHWNGLTCIGCDCGRIFWAENERAVVAFKAFKEMDDAWKSEGGKR